MVEVELGVLGGIRDAVFGPNPIDVAKIANSKLYAMVLDRGGKVFEDQAQHAQFYLDAVKEIQANKKKSQPTSTPPTNPTVRSDELKEKLIQWAGWLPEGITRTQSLMLRRVSDVLVAIFGEDEKIPKELFLAMEVRDYNGQDGVGPATIHFIQNLQQHISARQ